MAIRTERGSLEGYLTAVLSPEQRRSLFIPSFSQWGFALATIAETALTMRALGAQVSIGFWGSHTPLEDTGFNDRRDVARLLGAMTPDMRTEQALRNAGMPASAFLAPPRRRWRPAEPVVIDGPMPRSRIRELTYRGTPMGRAILQINPNRNTPVTDEYMWPRRWLQAAARSYAWAFDQTLAVIERDRPTAVAVLNGRFLHDRAATEAAKMAGLPILSYDIAGADTDFDLSIKPLHDFAEYQRRILAMYQAWDPDEREEIGARWFDRRVQHADPNNALFIDAQRKGELPDIPPAEQVVVFFSSSLDEMAELEVDWSQYFGGQGAALIELARQCRERPGTVLIVRSHPHKRLKPARDVEDWLAAVAEAAPDIHLDQHSTVDSYTLMRAADIVVTYGSTTGAEAAYAGKPVVVMGPSHYCDLGIATLVNSAEDLSRALDAPRVGDRGGAVAFGLMETRRGFLLEYVARRDGGYWLGDTRIDAGDSRAARVSHVLKRVHHAHLTRR